jgi:hypothetical protein
MKTEEGSYSEGKTIDLPDVIRRSYIETYRDCPYKFLHEVIKGIEAKPHIYNQMGSDLHDLFKVEATDGMSKTRMKDKWMELWSSYNEELFNVDWKVNPDKLHIKGFNSIDSYYHITEQMPKPYKIEEKILMNVGDGLPKVSCTLDRINLIDEEMELVDWKTGTVMVGQKLSSDMQAPLYIASAMENYKLPVRSFTLFYLDENKQRTFIRTDNPDIYVCTVNKRQYFFSLNEKKREVQHIFSQMKKGVFDVPRDYKKMSFTCKMCHLKKLDICKGAYMQSWHQAN